MYGSVADLQVLVVCIEADIPAMVVQRVFVRVIPEKTETEDSDFKDPCSVFV